MKCQSRLRYFGGRVQTRSLWQRPYILHLVTCVYLRRHLFLHFELMWRPNPKRKTKYRCQGGRPHTFGHSIWGVWIAGCAMAIGRSLQFQVVHGYPHTPLCMRCAASHRFSKPFSPQACLKGECQRAGRAPGILLGHF